MLVSFQNFDEVEKSIQGNWKRIGYVKLFQKVRMAGDERDQFIARYDLAPVRDEPDPAPADPEEPDDTPDVDQDDQEDDGPNVSPQAALLEWLRNRAQVVSIGQKVTKFQVRAFTKPGKYVFATIFFLQMEVPTELEDQTDLQDEPSKPLARSPVEPYVPGDKATEESHRLSEVADAYRRFTFDFMLPAVEQLGLLYRLPSNQLLDQNRRLGARTNDLVDRVMSMSEEQRTLNVVGVNEQKKAEAEQATLQKGIEELGSFGRTYWALKNGVPPSLSSLVPVLAAHPELAEILGKPETRAMIEREGNAEKLASILIAAGEEELAKQAAEKAAKEHGSEQPPQDQNQNQADGQNKENP